MCVEGRLYLEFMFDDMMRIKTWHFSIRQHRELIPRSILAMHVSECRGSRHPHRHTLFASFLISFPYVPGPRLSDAGPAVQKHNKMWPVELHPQLPPSEYSTCAIWIWKNVLSLCLDRGADVIS